ncbi:type II toxin-antitoxin system VapB family antitoxin [Pedobacter rhodius]|uniref:DUF2281 domain-containing protein n=1 Tax=Pedobacter rhodius TaxID=3004098 RepID=A0ABT4KS68_9SPHI|nr:DUF2281 domain-containing protein [Pedobacter sp. SJ11]MCZ4221684.1 DUF2281 domain-containing protein [Pedobacter sp. SJ11]
METLPESMVNEVEDFIDFLKTKHAKYPPESDRKSNLAEEPKNLYGAARGTIIYIADDFNEPLDDLKDYM